MVRVKKKAWNTMVYSVKEIERVARIAFAWARKRHNKVTSVDKANVLTGSRLWRDTVKSLHEKEFSDVKLEHMYIDNAAMQMVINPRQFDVILTGNIFGDILSDSSATLGGSLGLSISICRRSGGIFEPVHGSAPDIAGEGKANPLAMILSASMMLDTLNENEAASAIRKGVEEVLNKGYRSGDLWRDGNKLASTKEIGTLVKDATCEII